MSVKTYLNTNQMNALTLAFLGDSIFTMHVRNFLIGNFDYKISRLNKMANGIVCAKNQAVLFENLKSTLTEEENEICLRARNAHSNNIAKNATREEYGKATQFEALLGYLFLENKTERLNEILKSSTKELI